MVYKILKEENLIYKISYFLIFLIPIFILSPSFFLNLNLILLSLLFVFIIFNEKKFNFIKADYFFLSCLIFFIYLIFNLKNSINFENSLLRTFGFIRFILFSYAIAYFISYKKFKYLKKILYFWLIIFIIVSIDLLIEFIFGTNLIGYKNEFPGRLSGFLNDELKIGHYYRGFVIISLLTIILFIKKKKFIIPIIFFFLLISIFIGERANFIKLFFSIIIFISLINLFSLKEKIFSFIAIITIVFISISNSQELKHRFDRSFLEIIYQKDLKKLYYNTHYGAHYGVAIKIAKDNFTNGIGLKNFFLECSTNKDYIDRKFSFYQVRCANHPHQIHLDIFTSTGLIGYILILNFIFYLLFKSYKIYQKNKNLMLLSGIIFIISSLFLPLPSGSFFTTYGASIFWTNVGFLLAFIKNKNIKIF